MFGFLGPRRHTVTGGNWAGIPHGDLDDAPMLLAGLGQGSSTNEVGTTATVASATAIERMSVPPAATAEPTTVVTGGRCCRVVARSGIERSVNGAVVPIGAMALADLTVDMVAEWSAANEAALAKTTASIALLTLRSVLRFAVRRPRPMLAGIGRCSSCSRWAGCASARDWASSGPTWTTEAQDDFVFTNSVGRPLDYRKVGEAFREAVRRSGVATGGCRCTRSVTATRACSSGPASTWSTSVASWATPTRR